MNKTIYKQADSRWSSLAYPTKASSFGGNGCGCCACVHIAIEQKAKKKWTPKTLRPWMVKKGFAVAGQGTTWSGIKATLEYIGHKKVVWIGREDPMSKAWKELNKGNRIGILLVDNSKTPDGTKWTASGHYVAFTDYKLKDGKHYFYIKDSGGRNHDGWFCYEKSIKYALPQLWIVERIKEEPTKAEKLAKCAYNYAYTTNTSKARYPSGSPKPAYKEALYKVYPNLKNMKSAAAKGASCDVFVGTCVRSAGIDKEFPRGLSPSYLAKSDKFKQVKVTAKTAQDGDIIITSRHVCIVYGGKIKEASNGDFWPLTSNTLKTRLNAKGAKVYRAK